MCRDQYVQAPHWKSIVHTWQSSTPVLLVPKKIIYDIQKRERYHPNKFQILHRLIENYCSTTSRKRCLDVPIAENLRPIPQSWIFLTMERDRALLALAYGDDVCELISYRCLWPTFTPSEWNDRNTIPQCQHDLSATKNIIIISITYVFPMMWKFSDILYSSCNQMSRKGSDTTKMIPCTNGSRELRVSNASNK